MSEGALRGALAVAASGDAGGSRPGFLGFLRQGDMRLLGPALAAWAMVAVQINTGLWPWWVWVVALVVVAGFVGRAPRREWPRSAALLLVLGALTSMSLWGFSCVERSPLLAEAAASRRSVAVVGVVTAGPVVRPAGDGRPARARMTLQVERMWIAEGDGVDVRGVLEIDAPPEPLPSWRSRIRIRGTLVPVEGLRRESARLQARAVEVLEAPGAAESAAEHVRGSLRRSVDDLPDDTRGLVPAMVVGDRSLTPESLTEAMRATGMSHLSAVSGSNVAIVVGVVLAVAQALRCPMRWRPGVAGIALVCFVLMARPEPSVVRAAVMGAVALWGMWRHRQGGGLPALGGAVVLLLVVDPWLATTFGFALSVLATVGILWFAVPWGEAMARPLPRWMAPIAQATAVSLAAQVVCAPVSVLLQGGVAWVGLPANVVAAPFVAPTTVVGVVAAAASTFTPQLGAVVAQPASWCAMPIAVVARVGAAVPGGTFPWPATAWGAAVLAVITVIVIEFLPRLGGRGLRWATAVAAALAMVLITQIRPGARAWPLASWSVLVCDVGQGDALIMATGTGRAVLVDTGPDPAQLARCLDDAGVRELEAVLLTHFHRDHVGGLEGLGTRRPAGGLLVSPIAEPVGEVARVARWAAKSGTAIRALSVGERLQWGDAVMEVVWPRRRIERGSVPNNGSLVVVAEISGVRCLLLGDVEREAAGAVAHDLSSRDRIEGFDVVKVAHHGSANQDPALVDWATGSVAVVSVGRDNDYGHPSPGLMQRLQARSGRVVRTDDHGDIAVARHDGALVVATRRG